MAQLELVRQTAPLPDGVDVVGTLTIPAAGGWWYDRPVVEGVYSIVTPQAPVDEDGDVYCRTCGGECRA